jgi:hypothetical protein
MAKEEGNKNITQIPTGKTPKKNKSRSKINNSMGISPIRYLLNEHESKINRGFVYHDKRKSLG